jgi:trans-aconitate 2-methyltransferase
VSWDPNQYLRFGRERARPFVDLVAAIPTTAPRVVVDLGCGPGGLTATLLDRWPDARVLGIDSSAEMVAAALSHARPGRLDFEQADLTTWRAAEPVDVLVSNAALHWVPDHGPLLVRLIEQLAPAGTLAFQVPDNFSEPTHTALQRVLAAPRWRERLAGVARPAVETPRWYLETLVGLGLETDVWQTTYHHLLRGDNAVLEWVKGTTLRPVLAALDGAEGEELLADYAALLQRAYPQGSRGTVLPFRRVFVVALKAG